MAVILVLSVLKGLLIGLCFSAVPGPTGYGILSHALIKERLTALKWLMGLIAAEIIILVLVLSISPLAKIIENNFFEIASGLFLIGFSVFTYFNEKKHIDTLNGANPLLLTLSNPAVWIGLLVIIGMSPLETSLGKAVFLISLELGTILWYVLLILIIHRVSSSWFTVIRNFALFSIAALGAYTFIVGLN